MPSPAPLRLVASRAAAPRIPATLAATRLASPTPGMDDKGVVVPAAASFAVHAAVLLWMAINGVFGEERAAGAADELVLIEGIAVELVAAAPVPEAPPVEAAPEAEAPAPETPPPEPPEEVAEPLPETTEPTRAVTEAVPELIPTPMPETLPRHDAKTVPTPRARPERTEVAEAEPPPEPAAESERPEESRPESSKPAAPPPSAPSAAQSAARSGGAGGGGASQAAGNAAASAYRAKVAAQLKRKRFYPNAARRDRLTGTATVSFTLNGGGRVTAARVVRSSGERILDEAAVEMVRRASPYPPIPPGLGATITIEAPIGFELPR